MSNSRYDIISIFESDRLVRDETFSSKSLESRIMTRIVPGLHDEYSFDTSFFFMKMIIDVNILAFVQL